MLKLCIDDQITDLVWRIELDDDSCLLNSAVCGGRTPDLSPLGWGSPWHSGIAVIPAQMQNAAAVQVRSDCWRAQCHPLIVACAFNVSSKS